MEEFILQNEKKFPELINYMGFAGEVEDGGDEDEKMKDIGTSEALFEKHLSFDEMILAVRQGRLFSGRLTISRTNSEEATVSVAGLN